MRDHDWRVKLEYQLEPEHVTSVPENLASVAVHVTAVHGVEFDDLFGHDLHGVEVDRWGEGGPDSVTFAVVAAAARNLSNELRSSEVSSDLLNSLLLITAEMYGEAVMTRTPLPVFGSAPHDWIKLIAGVTSGPAAAAVVNFHEMDFSTSVVSMAGSVFFVYIAGPVLTSAGKGAAALLDVYINDVCQRAQERVNLRNQNREERRRGERQRQQKPVITKKRRPSPDQR